MRCQDRFNSHSLDVASTICFEENAVEFEGRKFRIFQ